jgi:hypothetical protein
MPDTELSSRERHQLLTILRELDPAAPAETRKHPRRSVALDATIRIFGGKLGITLLKAKLVNVSPKGLAITLARPLQPGDRLAIPLRFDDGGGWLALCEVKNARSLSPGLYRVGLQILERIDDPEGTSRTPMDWVL